MPAHTWNVIDMRIHKLNNGDTQRTIDNPWDVRAVHKLHGGGLLLIGINRYQQNEVFRWSITNLGSVPDFHSIRYSFKPAPIRESLSPPPSRR